MQYTLRCSTSKRYWWNYKLQTHKLRVRLKTTRIHQLNYSLYSYSFADRFSFVARFLFLRRRFPPSFNTSTAFASSGIHSYQIFKYLKTLPHELSSKKILVATTSQACSFLHWPLTFWRVLSAFASQSLSLERPAGILGQVTWSSRPQKALRILISSYCLHCTHAFSPSQITVKF